MRQRIAISILRSSLLVAVASAVVAGCGNSTDEEGADGGGATTAPGTDAGTGAGGEGGSTATGADAAAGGKGAAACSSANVSLAPATFLAEPTLTGTGPKAVAVGDVNKDGNADIVALSAVDTAVALGKGDGTFGTAVSVGGGGNNGGGDNVVIVDINGDTWPDLVTFNGSVVEYAPNSADGSGSFTTYQTLVTYPDQPGGGFGVVADFNGDGSPDVASSDVSGGVDVAIASGKGVFAGVTKYTGSAGWSNAYGDNGDSVAGIAAGDVNGDGLPDILLASGSNASQGNPALGGLCVSINQSHGASFADPVCYPFPVNGFAPSSLALGDFNKDGALDAAIGGTGGGDFFEIYLNKGDKTGTFATPAAVATGMTVATSLATADLNNDGNLDLVDFYNFGGLVVVDGNGDGTFASNAASYAVGNAQNASQSAALATGIFNGTGLTGIAVVNNLMTSTAAPSGGIQILAGTCSQ